MTTVSIITPAFNVEQYIIETAFSVLFQTFEDWEWIVVDDGSTDRTSALVAEIGDDRITLLSQDNRGVSAARNAGLDIAKGKYVTFLDADDLLPQQSLMRRVCFLDSNPDVGLLNGRIERFGDAKVFSDYQPSLEKCEAFLHISQLEESVFFGPFYMIRRFDIGELRFRETVSHCEDMIFFTELAHKQDLIYAAVDDCIYKYRIRPGSAMSNVSGIERGYHDFLCFVLPLERMTPKMRGRLKLKVASILVKSWLRRARPNRAIAAVIKTFRC